LTPLKALIKHEKAVVNLIDPNQAKQWYEVILITGGGWVVALALGGFLLMKFKWERADQKAKIEQEKESERVWANVLDKVLSYIENSTQVISKTGEAVSQISETQKTMQITLQSVLMEVCKSKGGTP
jgi:hypothetical protein